MPDKMKNPIAWLRHEKPHLFEAPPFWPVSNADIGAAISKIQSGESLKLGTSAGGKPIPAAAFGQKEPQLSTATISSALGSGTIKPYYDGSKRRRPVLVIIGSIHGGETPGVALCMNLLHLLESGSDLLGRSHSSLRDALLSMRLIIVPCLNPDGRETAAVSHLCGASMDDMRLVQQGIRHDGTLFGGPEVKEIQPIPRDYLKHTGGYYNASGINLQHDDFFGPEICPENKAIQQIFRAEIPDAFITLHAHQGEMAFIVPDAYLSPATQRKQIEASTFILSRLSERGCAFSPPEKVNACNWSFNFQCWLHHMTGALPLLFEFSQNMASGPESLQDTLDHGLIVIESWIKYCQLYGTRSSQPELFFTPRKG